MTTGQHIETEFLEAYEMYADAIFRYCKIQTSDHQLALDLAQDTFTKTWEYLSAGKKVDQIRPFLYKVATNLIIDYRRKKKSYSLDAMLEVETFDIKDSVDATERHETIFDATRARDALSTLDEKYRDVLTLRYIDDLSIKEIAEITGASENATSVKIHRGLEKLKTVLGSDVPEPL